WKRGRPCGETSHSSFKAFPAREAEGAGDIWSVWKSPGRRGNTRRLGQCGGRRTRHHQAVFGLMSVFLIHHPILSYVIVAGTLFVLLVGAVVGRFLFGPSGK